MMPFKTAISELLAMTLPALSGFFAVLITGGTILSALLVGAIVKFILYFFQKEIKAFANFSRNKINSFIKKKK